MELPPFAWNLESDEQAAAVGVVVVEVPQPAGDGQCGPPTGGVAL